MRPWPSLAELAASSPTHVSVNTLLGCSFVAVAPLSSPLPLSSYFSCHYFPAFHFYLSSDCGSAPPLWCAVSSHIINRCSYWLVVTSEEHVRVEAEPNRSTLAQRQAKVPLSRYSIIFHSLQLSIKAFFPCFWKGSFSCFFWCFSWYFFLHGCSHCLTCFIFVSSCYCVTYHAYNYQRLPWNYSHWWELSSAHHGILTDIREERFNVIMMRSGVISWLDKKK